jgi:heterodisulfide reductase subunit B
VEYSIYLERNYLPLGCDLCEIVDVVTGETNSQWHLDRDMNPAFLNKIVKYLGETVEPFEDRKDNCR